MRLVAALVARVCVPREIASTFQRRANAWARLPHAKLCHDVPGTL